MAGDDLKLDISFSSSRGSFPYIAAAFAVLGIIGIVLVMTTDLAAKLLPMDEKYFYSLVPTMPDGSPPLSLKTLSQASDNKTTLSVEGTVMNRTSSTISGLLAVIDVKDGYTLPGPSANVPVDPVDLPAGGVGKFQTMITLGEHGLSSYVLQFRLPNDGPFVPHKDEHPLEPTIEPPKRIR